MQERIPTVYNGEEITQLMEFYVLCYKSGFIKENAETSPLFHKIMSHRHEIKGNIVYDKFSVRGDS